MLTKGSFTRDEWDHLLRLLEYHEFLDVFVQPFSFKQKAECHVQESSAKYSKEGSAVAKPRPMNLVLRNPPDCEGKSSVRFE